jgi:hypothetical protein
MADRNVCIRLGDLDRATVELDGQDVTDAVRGFRLDALIDHRHQLNLDLLVHTGEVDGRAQVHVSPTTAAVLVALGWTPPPDGQPVDLTAPERHDAVIKVIKREARRDPDWFRTLLNRQARAEGGAPTWLRGGG